MAYFVNASGVEFEVLSKGEHTIGRGPLLKVNKDFNVFIFAPPPFRLQTRECLEIMQQLK